MNIHRGLSCEIVVQTILKHKHEALLSPMQHPKNEFLRPIMPVSPTHAAGAPSTKPAPQLQLSWVSSIATMAANHNNLSNFIIEDQAEDYPQTGPRGERFQASAAQKF